MRTCLEPIFQQVSGVVIRYIVKGENSSSNFGDDIVGRDITKSEMINLYGL